MQTQLTFLVIVPATDPLCTLRCLTGSKCSREFHSSMHLFLDHLQVSILIENDNYMATRYDCARLSFSSTEPRINACQKKGRCILVRTWNALFEDRDLSSSICPVMNLNRLGFSVIKSVSKSCNSSSDRLSRFLSAHWPMIISSSSHPLCFA